MKQPSAEPFAVFGATGQQGGAVVDALLAQQAPVRALVREPDSERAQALAHRGVELARIDIEAPDSLVAALAGSAGFFFMTTPSGGMENPDIAAETPQGIALAEAAAKAGVPHTVYSSVGGADRDSGVPHFETKRRVEEKLDTLDIRTTLVRPTSFMENFAFMGPSFENGELVVRMPLPDGIPLQMIAVRDIGVVAARALLRSTDVPDVIEIAGDARTGSEIADAFAKRTGLPARYEALPIEVLQGNEDSTAMFRWFAETPAYQADIDQVRSIHADVWDLTAWLDNTRYTAPDPM
jgi:uncharacterized protein YbjT (DUF2867 family)